jgi:hypothetical protein
MASTGVAGPGFILAHNGTTVAQVLDIKGPEQKAETDEITNQSSPGFYKEFIVTLLDGGDVKFKCVWFPGDSSQAGLLTALQGRALEDFTITPPAPYAAHVVSFSAYVIKWGEDFPHNKKATIDVDLRITGPVSVA